MSDNANLTAEQQERFRQLQAIQQQIVELQLSALGSQQFPQAALEALYRQQRDVRAVYDANRLPS
jgi:hypothetical protein